MRNRTDCTLGYTIHELYCNPPHNRNHCTLRSARMLYIARSAEDRVNLTCVVVTAVPSARVAVRFIALLRLAISSNFLRFGQICCARQNPINQNVELFPLCREIAY